jgi:hypothetical protein
LELLQLAELPLVQTQAWADLQALVVTQEELLQEMVEVELLELVGREEMVWLQLLLVAEAAEEERVFTVVERVTAEVEAAPLYTVEPVALAVKMVEEMLVGQVE